VNWFTVAIDCIVAAFWNVVGFMSADEWQAVGTVATFFVALAAALYASRQVREARRTREDQARPYVAVFLEVVDETNLDLVVKNFGATTARNVTIHPDKPMKRYWGDEVEDLLTFDILPVLVPGQDWRTLFDVHGQRMDANNYDAYTVKVRYDDIRGRHMDEETFVLDWSPFKDKQFVGRRNLDDIGKAVEGINKTLGKWTEGVSGLSVVARDGHKKDAARVKSRKEREAQRAAWQASEGLAEGTQK
jgi:hypothetical protein